MATAKPAALDPQDQVALLRRKLDRLSAGNAPTASVQAVSQAATLAAGQVADRVQSAAATGLDAVRGRLDVAVTWIRERPITAVLSAAGIGYVVGRLRR